MNIILLACLAILSFSQNKCTLTPEFHLPITYKTCTNTGCNTNNGALVVDINWRWNHYLTNTNNCRNGNSWTCGTSANCGSQCCVEGIDSTQTLGTYGLSSINSGSGVQINFVTQGPYSKNVGGRLYLLESASSTSKYKTFLLKNREFAFNVSVSSLQCGINGALYFVAMKPDGGLSFTPNKVGAQYGSGYCDAQCPTDISYIGGQANSNANWGSCCPEFDVWEANKYATAYTAHPCKSSTPIRCTVGVNCAGQCDQSGCDFNPYRQGNKTFYGPGSSYTIDTTQPFTVVTQFYTNNNQDTGNLTNIVRYYIQNGKKILNSNTSVSGLPNYSSINDTNCNSQFTTYGDTNVFKAVGGMTGMGKAMANGMVLVLSLWDDYSANMLWLDSNYPTSANPSNPGVSRGPCGTGTGSPGNVQSQYPSANVQYSDIRHGPIGSTYK